MFACLFLTPIETDVHILKLTWKCKVAKKTNKKNNNPEENKNKFIVLIVANFIIFSNAILINKMCPWLKWENTV